MVAIARALRVLVVDDEPLMCWSLAETLRAAGDDVTDAFSAEDAVRALTAAPPPDVVLLDYHLPDCQDFSLLNSVRRLAPESRIIVLSAYCTPGMAAHATELGACRVVSKPVDMSDVPPIVHDVC